jgi:HEAT repeat protein
MFNTIAPDIERKRRVLTMTKTLLTESDFGQAKQFDSLWGSMEELLISYDETPYTSEGYRAALDGIGERGDKMAEHDLPPELAIWMETLGQANIRTLSATLLIDLLTLERVPERAAEIARDMQALAEDLLMSGSYRDVLALCTALNLRATSTDAIGSDASRAALARLGESMALRETTSLLAEVEPEAAHVISLIVQTIGPAAFPALTPLVLTEPQPAIYAMAMDLLAGFGPAAIAVGATLVADERWFVQRNGAQLLGRLGRGEAVPMLVPLLRGGDLRVIAAVTSALVNIPDPAAARAIHTVLRTATGVHRRVVIDTLATGRDVRVIPTLLRIIDACRPLGRDHQVVLDAVSALGTVGSDQSIAILLTLIGQRSFWRRRRLRALKASGVQALSRIGSPAALAALDAAVQTGDRMLKRMLAERRN